MTTGNRNKYYNNMSSQERSVRYYIEELKFRIKCNKNYLTHSKYKHETLSNFNIAESKLIIKALKKQLPQKIVFKEKPYLHWVCPSCHYQAIRFGEKLDGFHCKNCGQRLNS